MSVNIINGLLNTTALVVAGVYVDIIPPAISQLNGVPTNVAGLVGTASFGPTNVPTAVADYSTYSALFGPIINRAHDLGTAVQIAAQQGANAMYVVRQTDGTDTAALGKFGISGANYAALFTARYTGSAANGFTITITSSAIASSLKVIVTSGLGLPEVFDGITNTTPAAFWAAMVNAINNGTGATRGRSNYVVATTGTLTTAAIPTVGGGGATLTLSGGTDGVSAITDSLLVGTDGVGSARTGMYALRSTGCSVATLVDCVTTSTWPTQVSFGLSEQMYMIGSGPAGDNIANAVSTLQTSGASSYAFKCMFGDWPSWLDTVNNVVRTVSPTAFVVGRLVNLSPQYSTLNQQIYGIVGTQSTAAGSIYSSLDLQTLAQAGIDVIINPSPGGQPFFACASGHNTSTSAANWGDNYTRMTNYLATTIANGGTGEFIGQPITATLLRQEKGVLDTFMQNMVDADMIAAYRNTVTSTASQQANGITVVTSQVQYLAINEKFVVQLQGGQTVSIERQSAGPGQ